MLKSLDDASLQRFGWDPSQATANAALAAADPAAIGYIGDLDSGATAVAIPLLNHVGIAEVSPTSTAVGLTSLGPGTSPGEPAKYYPAGKRTFVALSPNDAVQSAAQVQLQLSSGCTHTYVLYDDEFDGYDAAAAFQLVAHAAGLDVIGTQEFASRAQTYLPLARAIAQSGADCVLVSAVPESGAARLTAEVAAALPSATIFATGPLAQRAFVDPAWGGIPSALDSRVMITAPAPGRGPAANAFAAAYSRSYGPPSPYAVYGYEAMQLLLGAINRATDGGKHPAERSKVVSKLFDTHAQQTPLGSFRVQPEGVTTLRDEGIYRVASGHLALANILTAPGP